MLVQQPELADQLALFQHEAALTHEILGPNALAGETLHLHELRSRWASPRAQRGKRREWSSGHRLGRRELFPQCQRGRPVRVLEDGGELGKELVTDGRQLVLASGALLNEFIPRSHPQL